METDAQFYRRRLAEEHRAIEQAETPEIGELHRALADGYAAKLAELGEADDMLPLD